MEKFINVLTPGSLTNLLTPAEKPSIIKLIVQGTINARDFKCMRDDLPLLTDLDLSETIVNGFYGTGGTYYWTENYTYLDNEIPIHCFLRLNMIGDPNDNRRSETVLTRLILPNTITSIADNAFTYHSGLKQLIIPNSVKVIGKAAFEKCSGLELLDVGVGVTDLGVQGFMDCKNLKIILMRPITPPLAPYLTFRDSYNHTSNYNCPIVYVPDQSIETYNNAEGFEYYHSHKHPQTYQYVIGITGLTGYYEMVEPSVTPVEPPVTPVEPPVTPVEPPVTPGLPVDIKYNLTVNYGKNGRVEVNSKKILNNKSVAINSKCLLGVVPNKGYKVDIVTYNNVDIKSDLYNNYLGLSNIVSTGTLKVTFKKLKTSWNKTELLDILNKFKINLNSNDNLEDISKWVEINS